MYIFYKAYLKNDEFLSNFAETTILFAGLEQYKLYVMQWFETSLIATGYIIYPYRRHPDVVKLKFKTQEHMV